MSQVVIYKGIIVEPKDRNGSKILIRTNHAGDAQKAGIPFKDMEGGAAMFEAWVEESEQTALLGDLRRAEPFERPECD